MCCSLSGGLEVCGEREDGELYGLEAVLNQYVVAACVNRICSFNCHSELQQDRQCTH